MGINQVSNIIFAQNIFKTISHVKKNFACTVINNNEYEFVRRRYSVRGKEAYRK